MSTDMAARLGRAVLPNPVLTASGCGGTGRELAQFTDLSRLGAFGTPSVMAQPRSGRPTPRIAETPSGLLGAAGLPGPGVDAFLARDLPWLAEQGARVVVSVGGNSIAEYAEVARRLYDAHDGPGGKAIIAVEVNIACPNAEDRGLMFGGHPAASAEVVRAVRANTQRDVPVFAKLSPDVADIVTIALACADAGADGLSLINTMAGMAIDTRTLKPALSGVSGGLSGPAIRPVAIRCVYQVHAALPDTPIIGGGGIATGLDALEFLLAGASAVSVGTTVLHDPSAGPRIVRELEDALAERGIARSADAVGLAHRPPGLVPRQVRQRQAPATGPDATRAQKEKLP
ncbi:MAG: dihydroorotate dehydrogenase family protein [Streptosporangiaceae bacterium]|nr:dihydroorotate dehydrogenase family protein [Streptosporangiaceae bacterium]